MFAVPYIVVDDQQAQIIAQTPGGLEIRDQQGRCLGYVAHGITKEDIALAKKALASDEPRYTTQEVLNHLRSLDQQ
jgi:hypothetical protein